MKKLIFLIPLLLLPGCAGRVSDTPDLTEEAARQQIETILLSLENYTVGEYKRYFSDLLTTQAIFEESIASVVVRTKLHNPVEVTVDTIQKGEIEAIGLTGFRVKGTFRCDGVDYVSDFDFSFINNPKNANWEIINFKFEEC